MSNNACACLSHPVILLALLACWLSGCLLADPMDGQPCLSWTEGAHPLLVGDTARILGGQMRGSDCIPDPDVRFLWSTADSAVVQLAPDGLIRGLAPGVFRLTATRDTAVLPSSGFVLPAGWTARISPDSATVQVGDTVSFLVAVFDSAGNRLPPVPFSLYTPEFERPGSGAQPLVDKYSHQHLTEPGVFRAVRPGRTVITGVIGSTPGGRRVPAVLTILPDTVP